MSSAVAATPGSSMTFTVTARNPTPYTWPPHVEALGVGIGNHWLSARGVEIQRDDGRSYLRTDVASGQAASLDLVVNAPATPGRYLLEFDMVHEGVTWFAQKGSTPLRLPVRVRSRRRLPWQPPAHQPEADAGTTRHGDARHPDVGDHRGGGGRRRPGRLGGFSAGAGIHGLHLLRDQGRGVGVAGCPSAAPTFVPFAHLWDVSHATRG